MTTFKDPLQFAYRPGVGVEDAMNYMLQRGQSRRHCEDHVLGFFQCFEYNSACTVRLKGCVSAAQEHHGGLCSHRFSSLCTLQTSSTTLSPVISRKTDESAAVGCMSDGQEAEKRELVDHLVTWCGKKPFNFYVNMTKKMIVDFRRTRKKPNTLFICRLFLFLHPGRIVGGGGGVQIPGWSNEQWMRLEMQN